jgi:hypothetical protein
LGLLEKWKSNGVFGKESMHKESDSCKESNNWKEEQHTCMGGRPNDGRVRVLVRYCNGLKSLKCINIDT